MKPSLNQDAKDHNKGSDKSLNQSLRGGSKKVSSMSSNGPPRNYCGALKMNLKTCAKGTKLRVYTTNLKFLILCTSIGNQLFIDVRQSLELLAALS